MSNALPYYPVRYDEDVYDANGNIEHEAGEYFCGSTNGAEPRIRWLYVN